MALSRPNAKITVNGSALTGPEAGLVRVDLQLSVGRAHDLAIVTVWRDSDLADSAAGDTCELALGETDDETDVFSGEVTAVEKHGDHVVIEALGATVALSRAFTSKTYLAQSIADIVRDLASEVSIDECQADAQLSAYSVSTRRPVWEHVGDLAALCGADVSAAPGGGLRFVPPKTGAATVNLRADADVLAWSIGPAARPTPPKIFASGSASSAGSEQWHWVLRQPADGETGPIRVVGGFHTTDAADQLTQALSDAADRAQIGGRATLVGHPELRPGDLISVEDPPGGDPGTLRLLAITHRLDARRGFTTEVQVEGAA